MRCNLGEYLLEDDGWFHDASRKQSRHLAAMSSPIMDKTLPHVRDYYFYACSRSLEMVHQALAWDSGQAPVVVLVCGRFHLHYVLRVLRSTREVSWAVVGPSSEAAAGSVQQVWGWQGAEEEIAPV